VPTGGKTRSSLAFVLLHTREHSFQRIIYAIPYMSIAEQTANVFRSIFPEPNVMLEHHSGIAIPDDPQIATPQQLWNRLTAENWDAPMIVTTTVQLFESLLAYTPSNCRKLHNLVDSVTSSLTLFEGVLLCDKDALFLLFPIVTDQLSFLQHYRKCRIKHHCHRNMSQ
jgi:CRISPR-associated endonuclease/helicase Cas3